MQSSISSSQAPLTFELILECIDAIEGDPSNNELWETATQNSLLWLLSRLESDGGQIGEDAGTGHLYCPRGCKAGPGWGEVEELPWDKWREVGAFQTRMFSFVKKGGVETWRAAWEKCIAQCVDCAIGHARAEAILVQRWLPLKHDDNGIRNFERGLDKVSATLYKDHFARKGLADFDPYGGADPEFAPTLADLGPALLASILCRPWALISDPSLLKPLILAAARTPRKSIPELTGKPIPGLLVLSCVDDSDCASWSRSQTAVIDAECWSQRTKAAFETIFEPLLKVSCSRNSEHALPGAMSDPAAKSDSSPRGLLSDQPAVLWRSLTYAIRSISPQLFFSDADIVAWRSLDPTIGALRHVVCGHLDNEETYLPDILSSFVALLDKVGSSLWRDEKDGWAGVVLASLVDNPAFERLYDDLDEGSAGVIAPPKAEGLFGWMDPFMRSQCDSPEATYVGNLGQLTAVLLERFQQLRFATPQRCQAIQAAVRLLSTICSAAELPSLKGKEKEADSSPSPPSVTWPHTFATDSKVLDVHSGFLAEIAFGPPYAGDEWADGRKAARDLIGGIAQRDASRLVEGFKRLSEMRSKVIHAGKAGADDEVEALKVNPAKGFWTKVYAAIDIKSKISAVDGLATLIPRLATSVLLDRLATISWLPARYPALANLKPACRTINDALRLIREPIIERMRDLADSPIASEALPPLLSTRGVPDGLIMLISSPDDALYNAALTVVRQWADCDSRPECFKALFDHAPSATLKGILNVLKAVHQSATLYPDAIGVAKRLVRCMTDVIDVLCTPIGGLLRDASVVSRLGSQHIQILWSRMCMAISEIFSKTPQWAEFGQAHQMTDWMRDALIFAEHMLEQVWTFEAAVSGVVASGEGAPGSPTKASDAASKMVDAFAAPTESLLNWLRLTDLDLLERAATVLVRMLDRFAKLKRSINPKVVDKLEKYLRQSQERKTGVGVILTEQQCANISNALARHPLYSSRFSEILSDDDEEIVLDPELRKQQKSAWSKVFSKDSKAGKGGDEIQYMGATTFKAKAKAASQPMKISVGGVGKSKTAAPAKKSVGGSSSLVAQMRRDFDASRHALHAGKEATSTKGPNFRAPTMKAGIGRSRIPAGERSTETSSDDDDEEEDKGLAALAKAQKPSTIRKAAESRRTVKRLDLPAHIQWQQMQAARAQRVAELRAEKLRMSPDFTALHRHILQWDYKHEGQVPPGAPTKFTPIPASFENHQQYLMLLEPLIMCELWQGISRAKEEVAAGEKPVVPVEIIGRNAVDDFIEVWGSVKAGLMPDKTYLTEADLVLLRAGSRCAMAKMTSFTKKPDVFELGLRLHMGSDVHGVNMNLVPKTKWEVVHLCSLSTTHREWAVLRSTPYLNLGDDVLDAHPSPPALVSDTDMHKIMKAQRVNEPQARAIVSSLSTPGFSLIQGPPGTGKTSTIVGLVGTFMSQRPAIPMGASGPAAISRKILLCAPSNAAVDEIAKRLKEGVRDARGELVIPRVVRIGIESKVNLAVKDIFIDELVEAVVSKTEGAATSGASGAAGQLQNLRQQIRELRDTRDAKQIEASKVQSNATLYRTLQDDITGIRRKIHELSQQLDSARDQQTASKRSLDAATRRIRMQILIDADVVCATLSGSGHDYMSQAPFGFETVVIDEACQCVEPASLIPLRYNAKQCIMVGDPLQLPPTVLSQFAAKAGYDSSLFVRMQRGNPDAVHLLSIQYRMNPEISLFPSKQFYQSRLRDGPEMTVKTRQPWHSNSLFPPYAFFHPRNGREERGRHHSLLNRGEATVAVAIYQRLLREYPEVDFEYRVGIITGYAAQVAELNKQFRNTFGNDYLAKVDINTVDGFQGQEKDIIILSCVRGGPEQEGIGFLKDARRMNVALTRAKSSLFILGDRQALKQNQRWAALIDDATERGVISDVDIGTFNAPAPPRVMAASPAKRKSKPPPKPAAPPAAGPIMTPQQMAAQSGIPGLGMAAGGGGGGGIKKRLASSVVAEGGASSEANSGEPDAKKVKVHAGSNAAPDKASSPTAPSSAARAEPGWDGFASHPSLPVAKNIPSLPTAVNGQARGSGFANRGKMANGRGRGRGRGGQPGPAGRGDPAPVPSDDLSVSPTSLQHAQHTSPAGASGSGASQAVGGERAAYVRPTAPGGASNGQPVQPRPPAKAAPNLFIQKKRPPPGPQSTGALNYGQDGRSVKQRLTEQVRQAQPPKGT